MTVSQMRLLKSETRDMADYARASDHRLRLGYPEEWQMKTSTFFTAFIAIAAVLAIIAMLTACGGAALQTISLQNQTERTIKELYVFPAGSKDRGKSRGALAPNTSTQVQMPAGNVEVYAISETVKIDDHTRDTPTASQGLELRGPLQVIFFDGANKPAAVSRPGVIGVSFMVAEKKPAPDETSEPAPAP
jgi:hypothetical protein